MELSVREDLTSSSSTTSVKPKAKVASISSKRSLTEPSFSTDSLSVPTKRKRIYSGDRNRDQDPGEEASTNAAEAQGNAEAQPLTVNELEYMVKGARKAVTDAKKQKIRVENGLHDDDAAFTEAMALNMHLRTASEVMERFITSFQFMKTRLHGINPDLPNRFQNAIHVLMQTTAGARLRKTKFEQAMGSIAASIADGEASAKRMRKKKVADAQDAVETHEKNLHKWSQRLRNAELESRLEHRERLLEHREILIEARERLLEGSRVEDAW